MGILADELTVFCQSTSLKGVPRAVKANHDVLKILWVTSTLIFVTLALYQTGSLIHEYFKFETVTLVSEKVSSAFESGVSPAMTFCNLNPFAGNTSSLLQTHNLISMEDFREEVLLKTNCSNCTQEDKILLRRLQNDLLTSHGFYSYINDTMASSIGHSYENFVVECYQHRREGFRYYKEECEDIVQVKQNVDYMFYNCYTINPNTVVEDDTDLIGYSVTLHLDNFFTDQYDYLNIQHDYGQLYGALMLAHPPGTWPMLRRDSIFMKPGEFSDVKLNIEYHERAGQPHGECKSESSPVVPGSDLDYSAEGCISVCLEEKIADACGCRDLFTLNILNVKNSALSYCEDPSATQDILLQRSRCAQNIREGQFDACVDECPMVCTEVKFLQSLSHATWPPDPFHRVFYDDYIAGREYEWRYATVNDMINSSTSNGSQHNEVKSLEYWSALHLINSNFLHADIYLGSLSFTKFTERPKTTIYSFLSQLGGALNLFAGITLVIFIEVLELLLKVTCIRTRTPDTGSATKTMVHKIKTVKEAKS